MKRNNILICVISLCSFYMTMRAELLIVQKEPEGFGLLPVDSGKHDEIRTIIENYQWPQCIINSANMSEQEKTDLLSPGKPYAEELFIQNKLQQNGKPYEVVFVPTTLYELFCLLYIFEMQGTKNPLRDEIDIIMDFINFPGQDPSPYDIELESLISQNNSFINIIKEIYKKYYLINGYFFERGAWITINNAFVYFLYQQYPDLQAIPDAFSVSEKIKSRSKEIATLLIRRLSAINENARKTKKELLISSQPMNKDMKEYAVFLLSNLENMSNLVEKVIDLEYEARKSNVALLLRGTSYIESLSSKKKLVGSTLVSQKKLNRKSSQKNPITGVTTTEIDSMSISFASSLFAGSLRDRGASAYYFLMGGRGSGDVRYSVESSIGYALFIDKKQYVEHRIYRLFFIPPLITLAGLLQKGEYFHPRTTVAISSKGKDDVKNKHYYKFQGLYSSYLADPSGVLLITREPLRHAELFSRYLAQHGRILQGGSLESLTPQEQQFAQEVLKSQELEAQFYGKMREVVKPAVNKKMKRMRARKQKIPLREQQVLREEEVKQTGSMQQRAQGKQKFMQNPFASQEKPAADLIDLYIRTVRHYERVFDDNTRDKDATFVEKRRNEIRGLLRDLESIKRQKMIKYTDLVFARRLVKQVATIVKEVKPNYAIVIPE